MCDRSWGVQDDLTGCQVDEDDWMSRKLIIINWFPYLTLLTAKLAIF